MVITGRTRNAFAGQLARGFESLRLRQIRRPDESPVVFFVAEIPDEETAVKTVYAVALSNDENGAAK